MTSRISRISNHLHAPPSPPPRSPATPVHHFTTTTTTPQQPLSINPTTSTNQSEENLYLGFDHLHLFVSNAKQAAKYYAQAFGLELVAYRGLETGHRSVASHVLRRDNVTLVMTSALTSTAEEFSQNIGDHIKIHGDGVKDVAFRVTNCRAVFRQAVSRGAVVVREPHEESDEHGTVVLATVATYGDTVHTFVQRSGYTGVFLPGFQPVQQQQHAQDTLPIPELRFIDHVVGNQGPNEMQVVADWYKDKLGFHRFWTVDDKQIHTEYSSLRSIVMADESLSVKMPINEPAEGKKKSQIQEFVDYYQGAGVQHVALNTHDCVETVRRLKARGVEFLSVPSAYYDDLHRRLQSAHNIHVKEDIDEIQRLGILVDFDDKGYLLQLFTKPVADRPTLFFEIIQRAGNSGFGAGNFKALFESIEREQAKRGNL